MNIKITYNWLLEYLDTDADPYELQKYLSLCGPSFERVGKVGDDYVFDIEVTSNRVDMASVFGIAQEAQAILPQFGKKAKLKKNPLHDLQFKNIEFTDHKKELKIQIEDPTICSRFTAVILSNIDIKPAPEVIRKRLQLCDIKSINNVIDISNYLMLELGQPTHMFDYDKIGKAIMKMRLSKPGEKLTTLDEKEIVLPGNDIVIEDGNGDLIDLCGIMGGLNSSITNQTKNVVFFVQTYDKRRIRKTSMLTGQRTVAATYFEKGLDEERVEPTLVYGVDLLQKYAGAHVASQLYDIYPNPYKPKHLSVSIQDIQRIMGIELKENLAETILRNLGFGVDASGATLTITVPSFRQDDINMKADISEEVARVYGYHNLPNNLQTSVHVHQPKEVEMNLLLIQKAKYFLKHLGLHEVMNYSMISLDLIEKLDLKPEEHLMLANTISEEIKYMRMSLLPSLIKNIQDNEGKQNPLKLFELAKVYYKQQNDLPLERYRLSIATTTDFFDAKGVVEALLREFHITDLEFKQSNEKHFLPNVQAEILFNDKNKSTGIIGQVKRSYLDRFGIKSNVILVELPFQPLVDKYHLLPTYVSPNPFAVIKLDLTIKSGKQTFAEMKQRALETSQLVSKIEIVDQFKDNLTLRFYFSSPERNITEDEAKQDFETIKKKIM